MKSFRFKLTALETLRQREESAAMEKYAKAILARDQAVAHLKEIETEIGQVHREWKAAVNGNFRPDFYLQMQQHWTTLQARQQSSVEKLQHMERQVQLALHDLQAARQKRQVVDKLKENHQAEHSRLEQAEDQAFLDEIAQRMSPAMASGFKI